MEEKKKKERRTEIFKTKDIEFVFIYLLEKGNYDKYV